jgi:hypothetical protein
MLTANTPLENEQVNEIFYGTFIEEYGEFLRWLHNRHCIRLSKPYLYLIPMPRIRHGVKYPEEQCARIIVELKLPPNKLTDDWNILYNIYLTEQSPTATGKDRLAFNAARTPYTLIPSTLAGWPVDIVEADQV